MTHLRSPSVHNLDLNPWSLIRYAGRRKKRPSGLFAPPYNRPNLTFFNAHCDKVIQDFNLGGLHIRARVSTCQLDCDGVVVGLSSGAQLSTANVVFAIGAGEQPLWPEWAPKTHERVHHVFDTTFNGWPSSMETLAVVGGGISAAQVALRLVDEGHEVHLISRHELREHQFDSDSGWLGPKLMTPFQREQDADKRRTMITEARHKGSVPPDVRRSLRHALDRQQLRWHQAGIDSLDSDDGPLTVQLSTGVVLKVDRVLMATGFTGQRPGGALIDQLVESASLPCASCGYPIVDKALRWHPRVYVSGPLAELELGPSSRNISGARRAAERVVAAARAQTSA
jgi:pyruvate/2-oxoglutarate dehydrogenase complex dihydrolipoamide dehydrogenase (E3) component